MADEQRTKPLGEILVSMGLVSPEQLEECVAIQSERAKSGMFLRLGELLVERGVLSSQQIVDALSKQDLAILVCGKCQSQFNVESIETGQDYHCARCGGVLHKPSKLEQLVVEDTVSDTRRSSAIGPANIGLEGAVEHDDSRGIAWFGSYQILGEIARGGMSVVYKARQPQLDRVVALKVILDQDNVDEFALESFRTETRAVSKLRHPNIVAIYEVGRIGKIDFFTMEYVEGSTLDQAVVLDNLSPKELARIFIDVCSALDYAHSRGVLHHDIKPKNILLDRYGRPVVVDFGISKFATEQADPNEMIGSPLFMAPEYISGASTYNVSCEVYALGTTLYQLIVGKNPNDDVDTRAILTNSATRVIQPLHRVATVPLEFSRTVMTALAKNPENRYATPKLFAEDLRRFYMGQEVNADRSQLYQSWRRVRGNAAAVLAVLVALALLNNVGLGVLQQSDAELKIEELTERANHFKSLYLESSFERIDHALESDDLVLAKQLLDRVEREQPEGHERKLKALIRRLKAKQKAKQQ